MRKLFNCLFTIFLLTSSATSIAQQVIKVGVGNFPPFFVESGNKGIFVEVVDEIFKQLPKYKVEYVFMSNHRILHEINLGKSIDVACNIFPNSEVNAYLSEPLFRFRDVAISKKSAQFKIKNISDLQDKSIAAYQGATRLLGNDFKQMAKNNSKYSEHAHPKDTTLLMLSGKKEIRVGDINIFLYDLHSKNYKNAKNVSYTNFNVHYLWPYVYSHMAFKNPSIKDAVNEVIKELKLNGTLEKIYSKHKMQ